MRQWVEDGNVESPNSLESGIRGQTGHALRCMWVMKSALRAESSIPYKVSSWGPAQLWASAGESLGRQGAHSLRGWRVLGPWLV